MRLYLIAYLSSFLHHSTAVSITPGVYVRTSTSGFTSTASEYLNHYGYFRLRLQRPITCLVFKVAKSAWLHFTHQTGTSLFPYINIFATYSWLLHQNFSSSISKQTFFQDILLLQRRQIMFATSTGQQCSEFFRTNIYTYIRTSIIEHSVILRTYGFSRSVNILPSLCEHLSFLFFLYQWAVPTFKNFLPHICTLS